MSSWAKQQSQEARYVFYSLVAHIGLLVVMVFRAAVFPSNPIELRPTVHVDLVALPDQTKTPDQQVDVQLPVKEDVSSPPAETDKIDEPEPLAKKEKAPERDFKKDARSALERLKAEVEKQKTSSRESLIQKERERLRMLEEKSRQALRGNVVHQGTSASGVMEETVNAYAGHVTERLRSNWALPTWLQSRNFRAVVRIYIDGQGRIVNYVVRQSSENDAFDTYVKQAVERSSPFAPPPAEMARQLQSGGMEVRFPL